MLTAVCGFAQLHNSIEIDEKSFAAVQTDAISGVAIDKITEDHSQRECARIKMRINRMTAVEIGEISVRPRGGNVEVMKCVVAGEGNGLIIELTAKEPTRFYITHPKYGDSNEVSLNLEGNKISTSKNYAVWLNEYLVDMPGRQDELRYVLTANAPETKDNDFTWADYQARCNNELVAVYGNFVNRALQLTQKYYEGSVPACGELTEYDRETLAEFCGVKEKLETLLENFRFRDALKEAMNLARIGNKYIADCEPWKVIKTEPERVKTIINISLQLTANLAIAFEPFLPFSSKRLREMLAMDTFSWEDLGSTNLMQEGHQMPKPELLFTKIEDEAIAAQVKKLEDTVKANEEAAYVAAPVKPAVSFEDFEKLDIRVGLVKACEKVKKSKKLLKFTLDDGSGKDRTILSGIAQWYEPEQLVGKRVLFIANFEPRKMMGEESHGMILSAVNFNGDLSVTTTIDEVKGGSQVG